MNLSGESVRSLLDYYKVDETEELLVIYDDISLENRCLADGMRADWFCKLLINW